MTHEDKAATARPVVTRASRRWTIGFDMGGTYVDLAARASDGTVLDVKRPYDGAPAASVLRALAWLMEHHGIAADQVDRLAHGSTVVTNLLLERTAPPVGVLTTEGFADVLTLGRQNRGDLYAMAVPPPVPQSLFPRALRKEVAGRILADGSEAISLDEAAVCAAASFWHEHGVEAVAVGFLHACRNPAHEQRVRAILADCAPDLRVSLSHEVDPEPREFERFLATALDAYARIAVEHYLGELARGCRALGLPDILVMRSDGFLSPAETIAQCPLSLAMSGPSATLVGIAAQIENEPGGNVPLIVMDIGGTTTDIGLIEDGRPLISSTLTLGPFTLRMRSADVFSVPVGGGSVARVNAAGAVRLGPESQGARPGPAAYGQGGKQATLTDALTVLDRLPDRLAGELVLRRDLAEAALAPLAAVRGCSLTDMAEAIVAAGNAAIAEGIKTHAYAHGLDPSDCVLVAAGGGGAQHAAEVADLAGVRLVRIPAHAGIAAALGLLDAGTASLAECKLDTSLDDFIVAEECGRLTDDSLTGTDASVHWTIALCYQGQDAPIELAFDPAHDTREALAARFDMQHARLRGHLLPGHDRRVLGLRRVTVPVRPALGTAIPKQERAASGHPSHGPCRLAETTTTIWVPQGWRAIRTNGAWHMMPAPRPETRNPTSDKGRSDA
ncbi:N-methylhydantoinase A [Gluconacetobacter sacchari DSM 12717]|uniref:Hydantoinase/oxoprolinase family protein n=2 Tax=Gluconacetobacter sacchari TaxID=92759 RepID=A0A7W4IFB1_9PROT|nr:hydantoinase/oxoprolinase family protein [Gluconacetobacter sacchari]MBB2161784.1 hydantoinase/oxoprolinase family protein [Gluconacetobacter sacchari]GBQ20130.1 N-methylhydantoinase A [Gluconacetobacter sacchari DSM 12717]